MVGRMAVRIGVACTIIVLASSVRLAPRPVGGFALHPVFDNDTPDDLSDDLLGAGRWSNVSGSLVEAGERGLGGGLEYSIASEFCDRLAPRFTLEPEIGCLQIREAIQRAFDRWAAGHPVLRFVDVSDRVPARVTSRDGPEEGSDAGAEIDLFVLSSQEYPALSDFSMQAFFYLSGRGPLGTNGQTFPGHIISSADIVINPARCWYLEASPEPGDCRHFESLLLHTIGLTLGLGQPDVRPERNFDTDDDPTNEMPIDCGDPASGLRLSGAIDREAVMTRDRGMAVRASLTNDDLAGRNFLYPIC